MVKQISDNEIYLMIKYIESVLWREGKRLSYIEDAQCLKVNAVKLIDLKVHIFLIEFSFESSVDCL